MKNVPTPSAPPLWKILQQSAKALQAIESGQSWTAVAPTVDGAVRSAVQAVVYAVLRNWWLGQALQRELLDSGKKMPKRAAVLLRIALVLLAAERFVDGAVYDAHTVVNQAVEAAKRSPKTRHVAGVVNACLRRLLRERDALLAQAMMDDAVRYNVPDWWLQRVEADHPEHWQALLDWQRQPAPLTLRINTARVAQSDYVEQLAEQGVRADAVGECGVRVQSSVRVEQLPGYEQGWFAVQDAAAQVAAPLLLDAVFDTVKADETLHVLDACAAPGGKTAHVLAYAEQQGRSIDVLALEVDAQRSTRIDENLARLGHSAEVMVADAADTASWFPQWSKRSGTLFFDAVLLDAPCTAAGIVRRHPDIALLRREEDVAALVEQQKRLLDALWPFVRGGGVLLYCTCSMFRAEGQVQLDSFLERNSDAEVLPAPGHLLVGNADSLWHKRALMAHNGGSDHDAFFYALLRKRTACSFG